MITDNHLGLEAPAKHRCSFMSQSYIILVQRSKKATWIVVPPEHKVSDFHLHHCKIVSQHLTFYIFCPFVNATGMTIIMSPARPWQAEKRTGNRKEWAPVKVLERCTGASSAVRRLLAIICLILARLRAGYRGKVQEKWKSWSVSWSSVLLFLCWCAGPFVTPPQPWLNHHYREHFPPVQTWTESHFLHLFNINCRFSSGVQSTLPLPDLFFVCRRLL